MEKEREKLEKVFLDLISTIENNAVDNKATITNVKLWADSWRKEWEAAESLKKESDSKSGQSPSDEDIKHWESIHKKWKSRV